MKKVLSAFLVIFLVFSLCGCITIEIRSSNISGDQNPVSAAESQASAAESREPVPESPGPEETSTEGSPDESSGEPLNPEGFDPLLWKVSDGKGNCIYLFGTIHVGDSRILKALALVERYIDECEYVAAEFDIIAYQKDMDAMARDLETFFYTDGTTIRDHLPSDLVDEVARLIEKTGGYSPIFEQMKPAMWDQLLDEVLLMTKTDLTSDYGADINILKECYDKGKQVLELESAAAQYALIGSFDDRLYEVILRDSLASAEFYGTSVEALYSAWLKGSKEEIMPYVYGSVETEDIPMEDWLKEAIADYNCKMGTERNLGMFEKARGWLESGKKVFVTAGEAHMIAEDGIVKLFEEAGYKVERISFIITN